MKSNTLARFWLALFSAAIVLLTMPGASFAEAPFLKDIRDGQDKTIVTMGTSLSASATSAWVGMMTTWLESEATDPNNISVVNVAVSAQSSVEGVLYQLPNAKAANPDVVFVEYGINDAYTPYGISLQDSEDNLSQIIDELQLQNPDTEFVLMTMNNPAAEHLSSRPDYADYYQIYRDVAQARGLLLIDILPDWLDLYSSDLATWNSYVPDGIHPNTDGATNIILPEIQDTLNNVPEPATVALLVCGGLVLIGRRRVTSG